MLIFIKIDFERSLQNISYWLLKGVERNYGIGVFFPTSFDCFKESSHAKCGNIFKPSCSRDLISKTILYFILKMAWLNGSVLLAQQPSCFFSYISSFFEFQQEKSEREGITEEELPSNNYNLR